VIKIVTFYVRMLLSSQAALLVGFVGMCFCIVEKRMFGWYNSRLACLASRAGWVGYVFGGRR
jgi:hypothetical protein